MPHLAVSLLGPMQVTRDGVTVTGFGANAARALLAYLVLHPRRPIPRETLAGLLWPEWPDAEALRNLRTALYRLREAIGDRDVDTPYLDITRHTIQFNTDSDYRLDVQAFTERIAAVRAHDHTRFADCASCIEQLTGAADLYRGDFMAGFSLDSAAFEAWIVVQREALHQQALRALERLADSKEAQHAYDQALTYARRQVALEPWRERAHRQAMRALALGDHRAGALAQFEACRRSLDDELGIEPELRTRDLYERIRAGGLQPPADTAAAAPKPPPSPPTAPPKSAAVSTPVVTEAPPVSPRLPMHPVAGHTGSPPTLEGEHRRLTLILADVPGSAALLKEAGTEGWAEIIGPALQILTAEAQRLSGYVRQTRPDALVAAFGVEIAHEDDPERAVLTALAMQQTFQAYIREIQEPLQLRVSVHTGKAIVSTLGDSPSIMGEILTTAEQIHAQLPAGALSVSDTTYGLVAPLFDWQPLSGDDHRPLAHIRAVGKGRGLPGLSPPLVGRDRELKALEEAIDRLSAGVGGIVTVVGEAGIGKSRLVAEARKQASPEWKNQESANAPPERGPEWANQTVAQRDAAIPHSPFADSVFSHSSAPKWIEGRCLSYATRVAYQMWVDMVRALVEASANAPPVEVRDALRRAVRALCPDRFDDVYPLLAWLMALPLDYAAQARLRGIDPEGLRVLAFRAIEMLLEGAASRVPLVVALEDLHWADTTSLTLLEHLLPLTERTPLLCICVMRPETEHRCWHIRELADRDYRHRHTHLHLLPLTGTQSAALISHLLTVEDLPAELRARVLARAEGNPFFLEEILRALIDNAAIVYDEDSRRWHAGSDIADLPVPATLHGVITSRIDRLPQAAKHVLQLAAVVGRIVPLPLLTAIASDDTLEDQLRLLQRAELLRERARLPETEYIFKHQLTQQAAYAGLLRRKRRTLHRRVAEALELHYTDRIEEQLGLLAHHWEHAGDAERAVHYLRRAGEQATARFANDEAVSYFSRALDLTPQSALRTRYDLLVARENVYDLLGKRDEQQEDLGFLERIADALDDSRLKAEATLRQAYYETRLSDYSAAVAAAQKAVGLAKDAKDVRLEAMACREWGRARFYQHRLEEALVQLERALRIAQAGDLPDVLLKTLHTLSATYLQLPDFAHAEACIEQELQLCREMGDRKSEGEALRDLGTSYLKQGYLREALGCYMQSLLACRETGNRRDEAWALLFMGNIKWCQGELGEATVYHTQALQTSDELGERLAQARSLIPLAAIAYAQGRYARTRHYCERALDVCYGSGYVYWYRIRALYELGRALAAVGGYAEARALAEQALPIWEEFPSPQSTITASTELAWLSHSLGEDDQARAYAERALAEQFPHACHSEDARRWGGTLTRLGRTLWSLKRAAAAAEVFQLSLDIWQEHDRPHLAIEALIGLAGVCLTQGESAQAASYVERVLDHLDRHPELEATEEPVWVCLISYQVLAVTEDPRARDVLEVGYNLLMERAAMIEDGVTRRSFLENVPANREIIEAWEHLQDAQAEAGG